MSVLDVTLSGERRFLTILMFDEYGIAEVARDANGAKRDLYEV